MKIEKYICDVCNKEFDSKELLPYRIMIYHDDEAMIFNEVCGVCTGSTISKLIEIKKSAKLRNKEN